MGLGELKNFHVPLPSAVYEELRLEAQRRGVAATALGRRAIETWLTARRRLGVAEAIAEYAREASGTGADLDADLERAAVAELLERGEER